MEITVAKERILWIRDQLSEAEAEEVAKKNKQNAFGAFLKVSNFLSRPREEDFKLTDKIHRYVPFWHIGGSAKYVYDRTVEHQWPTKGPEVITVTLQGTTYTAKNGRISVAVVEHCHQEEAEQFFVDGLTGLKKPPLESYLKFSSEELSKPAIEELTKKNSVAPPTIRASALVRDTASKMIHSIDADQVLEESVQFQHVDLYYHPIYAFNYHWVSKNKDAVVEVDSVTGQLSFSQNSLQQLAGNVFDYDFLFDIGKDAASMFIPGGGIAVKIAKKYMDATHLKK